MRSRDAERPGISAVPPGSSLALAFTLVGLVGPSGGRATSRRGSRGGPGATSLASLALRQVAAAITSSAELYRAIPNLNEQRAQREVIEDIQVRPSPP